jgi:hypothetical protein
MTLLHVNTCAISVFASLLYLHIMHCILLLVAHICSYTLDHAEPELEELTEQAQAKEFTNLDLDQGKPQCI